MKEPSPPRRGRSRWVRVDESKWSSHPPVSDLGEDAAWSNHQRDDQQDERDDDHRVLTHEVIDELIEDAEHDAGDDRAHRTLESADGRRDEAVGEDAVHDLGRQAREETSAGDENRGDHAHDGREYPTQREQATDTYTEES